MKTIVILILITFTFGCVSNKNISDEIYTIQSTPEQINTGLEFKMLKGKHHNHPSFAIWVEDLEGNYVETLFVTKYFATGNFGHGETEPGKWKNDAGEVRRPAALPYWSHKRNIKAEDGLYAPSPKTAVPDAISGATPLGNFELSTGSKVTSDKKFRVIFEINQPWDSNDFWSNNKFHDNNDYKTSLQPALIYAAIIDPTISNKIYFLNAIGHGHPSGKTGELFSDLSTITTAADIVYSISVQIK